MLLLLFFLVARKIFTMKTFSKALLVPVLGMSLALPASAATQAEIMAQIAELQLRISQLQNTSTPVGTSTYLHTTTLRLGSSGTQVKTLQECMNRLGYSTGVADGIYGKNTARGITSFQSSKGLVADGIIGPKTGPVFQAACIMVQANPDTPDTPDTDAGSEMTNTQEAQIKSIQLQRQDDAGNNAKNQDVASFTIELDKKSGDINIQRVDLFMEITAAAGSERDLWDILNTVTLTRDNKTVASLSADSKSSWSRVGSTDQYRIRLNSFESIIKQDSEAEFMVLVDTQKIKEANLDITIDMNLELRYRDGAGVYEVIDADEFETISFDITNNAHGDIILGLSKNNPDASIISGDEVSKKTKQTIMEFGIESQYSDIELEDIEVVFVVSGVKTDARDLIKKAYLYQGSKIIDSGSIHADGEITFDLDDFEIEEGEEETFTLIVDLDNIDGVDVTDGVTITAEIRSITAEDANKEDINYTTVLSGNTHSYSASAPLFKIQEINFDVVSVHDAADYATAEFVFEVTAGSKKDVYLSQDMADWGMTVTGATAGAFIITADDSDTEIGTTGFKIQKGRTETFTISQVVTGTNAYAKVSLDSVHWDSDNGSSDFEKMLVNGFTTFKTASKYITS